MTFFSGLRGGQFGDYAGGQTFGDYGLLANPFGPPDIGIVPEIDLAQSYRSLGRGGILGTGVTGAQLSHAFAAARQLFGDEPPPEPHQFHALELPHTDLSALAGGSFQRPVPSLNLAEYFSPVGYGRGY